MWASGFRCFALYLLCSCFSAVSHAWPRGLWGCVTSSETDKRVFDLFENVDLFCDSKGCPFLKCWLVLIFPNRSGCVFFWEQFENNNQTLVHVFTFCAGGNLVAMKIVNSSVAGIRTIGSCTMGKNNAHANVWRGDLAYMNSFCVNMWLFLLSVTFFLRPAQYHPLLNLMEAQARLQAVECENTYSINQRGASITLPFGKLFWDYAAVLAGLAGGPPPNPALDMPLELQLGVRCLFCETAFWGKMLYVALRCALVCLVLLAHGTGPDSSRMGTVGCGAGFRAWR